MSTDSTDQPHVPSLKVGETMRLDHLGPIIINSDGTTRRITNWDTMTERERQVALRRIAKRNKERIETLQGGQPPVTRQEEAGVDAVGEL
ncbi:hypothetical protein JKP88DRAFT_188785 [Tribonema minus]|uniref:Uncharacterized protein n=1 Tax=Tribonema minus TaxID=303371 RepID=A0A836CA33_9STRA|nr:hypothetical protein JKP88DRAFT_188785 [Tribonema minus]